jgi:hypothetical protein
VSIISTSPPGFFIKIVVSKSWKKIQKKLEKLVKFGLGKGKNSKKFQAFCQKTIKSLRFPSHKHDSIK